MFTRYRTSSTFRLYARAGWIVLAVFAIVLVLFWGEGAVHAQNADIQITLSPTAARLKLNPDSQYVGKFTVLNTGRQVFKFRVYATPYQVTNENYDAGFEGGTVRTQISRWISMPDTIFSLEPGGRVDVPYTVTVPAKVPSGGQYAVLFAETIGEEDTGGTRSVLSKKRVGMLVYASISGTTKEAGDVEFSASSWWQYSTPLTVTWRVKNTGNTDFPTTSKLVVKDLSGKVVYQSEPRDYEVLPDTTRAIEASWAQAHEGIYKVTVEAGLLGKTYAETHIVFVKPTAILVGGVGVLIVVIGGVTYGVWRHHRHKTRRRYRR